MIHGNLIADLENIDYKISQKTHERIITALNLKTRTHDLSPDDKRLYGDDATLTLALFNDLYKDATIVAAHQVRIKDGDTITPAWAMTIFWPPYKSESIAPGFARALIANILKLESYKHMHENNL